LSSRRTRCAICYPLFASLRSKIPDGDDKVGGFDVNCRLAAVKQIPFVWMSIVRDRRRPLGWGCCISPSPRNNYRDSSKFARLDGIRNSSENKNSSLLVGREGCMRKHEADTQIMQIPLGTPREPVSAEGSSLGVGMEN